MSFVFQKETLISVFNQSTVATDAQLAPIVDALQKQVTGDFYPVWGINAKVIFVPKGRTPDPLSWQLGIFDNSDQAGALGYHDITAQGQPLGKVFAETDIQAGSSLSVTMSHELCLTGDTKIRLLDGTQPKIKELVGRGEFWVYSSKPGGELRPGRGHSARLTRINSEIVAVTLDNGQVIRCTPDHEFMLRNGTYREAKDLQGGQSLMPLYTKIEALDGAKKRRGIYEYEHVYVPSADAWVPTHRMVVPYCSSGYVRHHKDFNRFNNSPTNFQVMKWLDHQKLHAEHIAFYGRQSKGKKRNLSDAVRQAMRESGRARLIKYNQSAKHSEDMARYYSSPAVRRERGERLRKYSTSPENIERLAELRKAPEFIEANRKRIIEYNKSDAHRKIAREIGKKAMALLRANPEVMARQKVAQAAAMNAKNHKVISVETAGREDVYDITVDKYHNFALDAGVFVHNCEMLADPDINLTAFVQSSDTAGTLYAYEVADACEDDSFGYRIDGILVSDFVYPAWFESFRTSGSFDKMGKISFPFQLLPGGYIGVYQIPNSGGWTQLNARLSTQFLTSKEKVARYMERPRLGSRRERRRTPRDQWVKSIH